MEHDDYCDVLDPVLSYVDRDQQQKHIKDVIEAKTKNVIVLEGVSGSGKTQLSQWAAHHVKKKFEAEVSPPGSQGSIFCFLECRRHGSFITCVQRLCRRLKLKTEKHAGEEYVNSGLLCNLLEKLILELNSGEHADSVKVFIFDGLDSTDQNLKDLFTKLQKENNAMNPEVRKKWLFFVTTSKAEGNQSVYTEIIVVEGFTSDQAVQAFRDASTTEWKYYESMNADIECICKMLGGLPLGLVVAVQYVVDNKMENLSCFVTRLDAKDKQQAKALDNTKAKGYEEDKSLFGMMRLQLCNLRERTDMSKKDFDVLALLALFDGEEIPFTLISSCYDLVAPEQSSQISVHDLPLFKLLIKWRLCELVKHRGQENPSAIAIHRVVQMSVGLELIASDQDRKSYLRLAMFSLNNLLRKNPPYYKQAEWSVMLTQHLQAVKCEYKKVAEEADIEWRIIYCNMLEMHGYKLMQDRKPEKAAEVLKEAYKECYEMVGLLPPSDTGNDVPEADQSQWQADRVADACSRKNDALKAHFSDLAKALMLQRCLGSDDLKVLANKLQLEKPVFEKRLMNGHLTSDLHSELVKCKAAVDHSKALELLLLELFVCVLYTCGRIYFYNKGFFKQDKHRKEFKLRFEIVYKLAVKVHATTGVRLIHELLSKRNGLLMLQLERLDSQTEEEYRQLLSDAIERYDKMAELKLEYFEKGLLKLDSGCSDESHLLVCYQQSMRSRGLLLALLVLDGSADTKQRELYHKGKEIFERMKCFGAKESTLTYYGEFERNARNYDLSLHSLLDAAIEHFDVCRSCCKGKNQPGCCGRFCELLRSVEESAQLVRASDINFELSESHFKLVDGIRQCDFTAVVDISATLQLSNRVSVV